jgi:hypothetical protein
MQEAIFCSQLYVTTSEAIAVRLIVVEWNDRAQLQVRRSAVIKFKPELPGCVSGEMCPQCEQIVFPMARIRGLWVVGHIGRSGECRT